MMPSSSAFIPTFNYGNDADDVIQPEALPSAATDAASSSSHAQASLASQPASHSPAADDQGPDTTGARATDQSSKSAINSGTTLASAPTQATKQRAGAGSRKAAGQQPRSILKKAAQDVEIREGEHPDDMIQVTPEVLLEVKRRKAAFKAMSVLIEQGAEDEPSMVQIAAPLSGKELNQVAEERALAGQCGNPLCQLAVSERAAARARWLAHEEGVEKLAGQQFCSSACNKFVEAYAVMLGDPMKRLKPEAREQLLVSHQPKSGMPEVAAQVNGVTTMLSEVKERAPAPAEPLPVQLQGASTAVEGYTPKTSAQADAASSRAIMAHVVGPPTKASRLRVAELLQDEQLPAQQPPASDVSNGIAESDQSQQVKGGARHSGVARHIHTLVHDISAPQLPRSAASSSPGSSSESGSDAAGGGDSEAPYAHQDASSVNTRHKHTPEYVDFDTLRDSQCERFFSQETDTDNDSDISCDETVSGFEPGRYPPPVSALPPHVKPLLKKGRAQASSDYVKKRVTWADECDKGPLCQFAEAAQPEEVVVTETPAGFTVLKPWVPPSSGSNASGGDAGSAAPAARSSVPNISFARRFSPRVPIKQEPLARPAPASAALGSSGDLTAGSQSGAVPAAVTTPVSDSTAADQTQTSAQGPASAARDVPGNSSSRSGSSGSSKVLKQTSLLRPANRRQVVVLDAPPDKPLTPNPVLKRMGKQQPAAAGDKQQPAGDDAAPEQQQVAEVGSQQAAQPQQQEQVVVSAAPQQSACLDQAPNACAPAPSTSVQPAASGATQPRRAGGGTAAAGRKAATTRAVSRAVQQEVQYTTVVPQPEVLPFEEYQAGAAAESAAGNVKGVWRIKSDSPCSVHAGGTVQVPEAAQGVPSDDVWVAEGTGQQQQEIRSDSSGRRVTRQGGCTIRELGEAEDEDEEDDSGSDGQQEEQEDGDEAAGNYSGSDSEESEGGDDGVQHSKRRSVRANVIYEDGEEEAADGDDLADFLKEISGGDLEIEGSESDEGEGFTSALPFYNRPAAGYKVELSPFNMLWTLVSSWATRETYLYMNTPAATRAVRSADHDPRTQAADEPRQDEEEDEGGQRVLTALPPPHARDAQARSAVAELLAPHMQHVLAGLRSPVSLAEVTKRLTGLLRTFVFRGPVPDLSQHQWRCLCVSILRALSFTRLPALSHSFEGDSSKSSSSPGKMSELLVGTGFELYHVSALVDLLLNE